MYVIRLVIRYLYRVAVNIRVLVNWAGQMSDSTFQ